MTPVAIGQPFPSTACTPSARRCARSSGLFGRSKHRPPAPLTEPSEDLLMPVAGGDFREDAGTVSPERHRGCRGDKAACGGPEGLLFRRRAEGGVQPVQRGDCVHRHHQRGPGGRL